MGEPLLETVGVGHRFGALVVLQDVDFAVAAGESVGIVGPNGAGKTTLLNLLSGSLRPTAGAVRLRGRDVTGVPQDRRCRLGVARVHQVPRPFGGMTVFENILVGATAGGGRRCRDGWDRALTALDLCGLTPYANRRADTLGLLHRKSVELARAVATDPSVLLLDEIGSGLTDVEAADLLDTIRGLRDQGITIVWIEHIVHVLVLAVERLVCMDAGRVIADGAPDEVVNDAVVIDAYLGGARA